MAILAARAQFGQRAAGAGAGPPAPARRAIIASAQWGYGNARNLAGILCAARSFHTNPRVVAAAFGFLRDAREPGS